MQKNLIRGENRILFKSDNHIKELLIHFNYIIQSNIELLTITKDYSK